jgi:GNAT superfamily N-acetyltransferase
MLISEIAPTEAPELQSWADQIKAELGLQEFDLWLTRTGDIHLSALIVPKNDQRTGLGTAAMTELCRLADRLGKRILLTPAARDDHWGTTSSARLVRFYKRFGFVENKGRNKDFSIRHGMYRMPNPGSG